MTGSHSQSDLLRGRAGAAFTLVELLLVMFVMSVLVALVVGVGTVVIEEGRKEETLTRQARLLAAIEAYRKVVGKTPVGWATGDIMELRKALDGEGGGDLKGAILRETSKVFGDNRDESYQDAYGKEMRYYHQGGLGGKPLIVSAGPDGDFGSTPDRQKDNIRSDIRDDSR